MFTGVLRPSSADIWTKCSGQPLLTERLPIRDDTSDEAMQGTCAAWLADHVLRGNAIDCRSMVGEVCPENNWPVDYEMANHIQGYVDTIVARGGDIASEERVYLTDRIHGTPDCYAFLTPTHELFVDDLKYGYGIVEPTSVQVAIYAAAIMLLLFNRDIRCTRIHIGIYQPRAYHTDGIYRQRTLTFDALYAEATDIIAAGERCLMPDPQLTPGKHCKYCPMGHLCPAVSNELYDVATVIQSHQARHLTNVEITEQLNFIDVLEDMVNGFKNGVKSEALARIEEGQSIPGWQMKHGVGNRRWKHDRATTRALTGIDAAADSMATPAAMERAGADPALIALVTEKPSTKAKLVKLPQNHFAKQFGE